MSEINNIDVECDRCGKLVKGIIINASAGIPNITGGFYDVSEGCWSEFAQSGEASICDACMWADPEFIAQYPVYRKLPPV